MQIFQSNFLLALFSKNGILSTRRPGMCSRTSGPWAHLWERNAFNCADDRNASPSSAMQLNGQTYLRFARCSAIQSEITPVKKFERYSDKSWPGMCRCTSGPRAHLSVGVYSWTCADERIAVFSSAGALNVKPHLRFSRCTITQKKTKFAKKAIKNVDCTSFIIVTSVVDGLEVRLTTIISHKVTLVQASLFLFKFIYFIKSSFTFTSWPFSHHPAMQIHLSKFLLALFSKHGILATRRPGMCCRTSEPWAHLTSHGIRLPPGFLFLRELVSFLAALLVRVKPTDQKSCQDTVHYRGQYLLYKELKVLHHC